MQVTIARQLCLDPSTVSNFFMNARRRSIDKWKEDPPHGMSFDDLADEDLEEMEDEDDYCNSPSSPQSTEEMKEMIRHHQQLALNNQVNSSTSVTGPTVLSSLGGHSATTISMTAEAEEDIDQQQTTGSTIQQVVQQQHPPGTTLTLTRYPDGTFKATPISTSGVNNHHSNTPTAVLLATANPAAVVQQLHPNQTSNSLVLNDNLTSTALDL